MPLGAEASKDCTAVGPARCLSILPGRNIGSGLKSQVVLTPLAADPAGGCRGDGGAAGGRWSATNHRLTDLIDGAMTMLDLTTPV